MTILRMLLIFLAFILLNIYLFIRGWQAFPYGSGIHVLYTVLYLVASLSVFIAIFLGNRLPLWMAHFLEVVGGYWIILFVFIISAAFLADVLRILNHFFHIFPEWITANYPRIKLYYFAGTFMILGVISVIGYIRFSHPDIKEINIQVNHGYPSRDELSLVAVSDIHLGNLIRKGRLAEWVDMINDQQGDIILIAGDLFDHNMQTIESQKMDLELARLNSKYGVYAIPGNHDYYAGIDKAINYMIGSGIHVLRDQAVTIDDRMVLIGRDDRSNANRKSLKSIVNGITANLPTIVLDHQPFSFAESSENDIDLHLSGHTHNGQIFPFNWIVSKIYELGYGYKKTGNTHFYVSSGLGLWGAPIRFGTRSEIVKIVIRVDGTGH